MDLYKAVLAKEPKYKLTDYGNYRNVQVVKEHDVMFVTDEFDSPYVGGFVAFLILTIIFCLASCFIWIYIMMLLKRNKEEKPDEATHEQVDNYDTARTNQNEN